jgi:PAS domain S-box-containing protein
VKTVREETLVTANKTGKSKQKSAKKTGKSNKPAKAKAPRTSQQAKDAPPKSEELYRTLVESALDGIVIHAGGQVAFANRAAAAMLGYAGPAALVGQPLASFVHPDDLASVQDRVRRVQAGETVAYPVEVRYVKPDGAELPVENTGALVTYEGKPAILAVIRDITARKRAEEVLRQSEERYRQLFEAESDAIFLVECETGRFVATNPSAERMYGYSRDEFLGLRAGDVSAEPEKTRQAIAAQEAHVPLRLHRRKDGTVFPERSAAATSTTKAAESMWPRSGTSRSGSGRRKRCGRASRSITCWSRIPTTSS